MIKRTSNKAIKISRNKFITTMKPGVLEKGRMKLMYEALKSLPDKFIDDKTRHCSLDGAVYVANPKYAPIIYKAKTKKWGKVKLFEIKKI